MPKKRAKKKCEVQKPEPEGFCETCTRNLVENTTIGADTRFWTTRGCGCAERLGVTGVIVVNGDRTRVIRRIARLLCNVGYVNDSEGDNG